MKRALIFVAALLALAVVASVGLAVLARRVFTGANVRAAVESQIASAIGQPVTIGGIGASVYPRVTVDLQDVTIGTPARLRFASVHLGTGLRALFSRRIEHADVRIDGARITLPLPAFTVGGTRAASGAGSSPVELVSVDEIVLHDVEVVAGNRTLKGDIELVPQGAGVLVRRIALAADAATVQVTGALTTVAPIAGRLDLAADAIDVDRLIAFVTDFAAASADPAAASGGTSSSAGIERLTVGMKVGTATTGGLTLSDFAATALVTPGAVRFEPLAFGVFGGRYDGTMQLALGDVPAFQWRATVTGVDAAALMAFAGSRGAVTGTLSGTVTLDGQGLQMEQALRTARGRARVDIVNGTIAGLQLVRTIVTATSGRGGIAHSAGAAAAAHGSATGGETFTTFGATLRIEGGVMTTDDMTMASPDLDLTAAGNLRLASMATDFAGKAQLSPALSQAAGTDLYRYTQEGGRVTLPVTVTGPIDRLAVRVDVLDAATRAIHNRGREEINKVLDKKLPGFRELFQKKPR